MKNIQEIKAKAKVFWEGGLKTRSIIRGFEVETDKPKSDFGTNMAPAPMEVFISGIGACLLSTFIWIAVKARVIVEDCIVDIKAYADNYEKKKKLSRVKITLTVWAENKYKNKIEQCFDVSSTTCPLTNAVSFPIESVMQFKKVT
ncbi:MAG: OsmC family protein [Thermoplasmata archaeon]|nr:MAG: OsmC family protein [Thermoplasmata archaeon]